MGQEIRSSAPASGALEQEALKVLNDSDWAHTVTPIIQDAPCSWQNAAFPGLSPQEKALARDAGAPLAPRDVVKQDGSEYLIRFQSAKPVQTAIQQMIAIGEKWSAYGEHKWLASATDGPTDLANLRYNVMDMITIAVILKHPDPDGTSLFDYGFKDNGRPSETFRVWPCAGLRTDNGQVFARVVPEIDPLNGIKELQLSFPRLIDDGKPLISRTREKVEFRLIVNQRVLETNFFINAGDVLDGSEGVLYLPSAFTDSKEIAQQ
jgi:hypothetical protein